MSPHSDFRLAVATVARSKKRHLAGSLCTGLLAAGLVLSGSPAPLLADCMSDIKGRIVCDRGRCESNIRGVVYCSRYEDGAAIRTIRGEVVCGKGDCVTTIKGDIICSARPRGAVMMDLYGRVTCEGGCERASARMCSQGD